MVGLRFAAQDPIIRPSLLGRGHDQLLHLRVRGAVRAVRDPLPGRVAGHARPRPGRGRDRWPLRGGSRRPDRPAHRRRPGLRRSGCILFPAPLILIPLVSGPPELIFAALLLSEFGAGFGVMILDVNVGAIIIARTPDSIRARATGAFRTLNYGVRPLGAFLGGVLGDSHRRSRDVARRVDRRACSACCGSSGRRSSASGSYRNRHGGAGCGGRPPTRGVVPDASGCCQISARAIKGPGFRPMPCQSSPGVLFDRRSGRNQADHGESTCL